MKAVTLVYAYYENYDMLARHVQEWSKYPDEARGRVRIIVVDDGSPRKPAIDFLQGRQIKGIPISLYRIGVNIPWNQDGARNLAMKMCDTDWALMTDMDHLLPAEQVPAVLSFTPQRGCYYMPGQRMTNGNELHAHPNTFLFAKDDFWAMGGYDEDFAGSYGSDGNFRSCARATGLFERETYDFELVVFRTEDITDANTKDWPRKGSIYHVGNIPKLRAKARGPRYRAINPIRFPYERLL